MAASLGCANLTASDELSCMQKVDAFAIQKYVRANSASGLGGNGLGRLVADNVTVFANNTERLALGKVAKVVSFSLGPERGDGVFQTDLLTASHHRC
jgi:hypothetical protein